MPQLDLTFLHNGPLAINIEPYTATVTIHGNETLAVKLAIAFKEIAKFHLHVSDVGKRLELVDFDPIKQTLIARVK